jgi:hypothetical protein
MKSVEHRWNYDLQGKTKSTWRKVHPSATFSMTNPAWNAQGLNPGLHGHNPALNRLRNGMVM